MTKKTKKLTAVLAGLACIASTAIAQEVIMEEEEAPVSLSVGVDFATAYVFRGVTYNDGMVAQPWMDATTSWGLNFGVWGNFDLDDYDDTLEEDQFSEIDLYIGWGTTLADMVDVGVAYCEYTYPMSDSKADREISLSAGMPVGPIGLGVAAYFGVGGGIEKTTYLEATADYGIDITEDISAGAFASVGYFISDDDDSEDGFQDYSVGVSAGWKNIGISVAYIGQGDDDVLPEEQYAYDTEVVGMLSLGYDF